MPCQCSTAQATDTTHEGCGCTTDPEGACDCGSTPTPSDRERTLEQVVMELDKRVRRLEAAR